jgi:transposase
MRLGRLHDWQFRRIQGPALGMFSHVEIRLYFPRAYCENCKTNQMAYVPFLHPHIASMSCAFAEVAGRLMEETTCEAAARLLHANSRTLWELDQFRMQFMLERMKLPDSLDLSSLSADEVHFRTLRFENRKGLAAKRFEPLFVTNLVCYENSKVLFNSLGRGSQALTNCLSVLSKGQKLAVENFAVDMHEPFISVIKKECPQAKIAVDRFHLAQAVNKSFDEVRKEEFRKARHNKDYFTEGMLSPSRRFVLVEREKNLSRSEMKLLEKLRRLNINIHSGMLLVEYFHNMLDKPNIGDFRKALTNWYLLARESGLKPFLKLARTIMRYRHYIESYIKSGLTTAVSEGLNNKIKTLKRMAYGYTNPKSFRNKILQRCGFLNHYHINTVDLFYEVTNPSL